MRLLSFRKAISCLHSPGFGLIPTRSLWRGLSESPVRMLRLRDALLKLTNCAPKKQKTNQTQPSAARGFPHSDQVASLRREVWCGAESKRPQVSRQERSAVTHVWAGWRPSSRIACEMRSPSTVCLRLQARLFHSRISVRPVFGAAIEWREVLQMSKLQSQQQGQGVLSEVFSCRYRLSPICVPRLQSLSLSGAKLDSCFAQTLAVRMLAFVFICPAQKGRGLEALSSFVDPYYLSDFRMAEGLRHSLLNALFVLGLERKKRSVRVVLPRVSVFLVGSCLGHANNVDLVKKRNLGCRPWLSVLLLSN